ncbi:restriction endonuclease [Streptomyces netropsis]|uniref:restriction endonuclease n=1 Tax=Streptomyces netropsis TaxID=55404 RepID=UPI0037ADCD0E
MASLKRWTQKHQGLVEEREALAEELAARRTAIQVQRGFAGKLTALEKQFLELGQMTDRQKAGLLLEPFLGELFALFDLDPRLSYKLESEQIDRALSFGTDDYIVEAKWCKGSVEVEDFDKFDAKVRRKGKNALGLFVSVNGFTAGALREYDKRTSFLTVDGGDLMVRARGAHRPRRAAATEGAARQRDGELLFSRPPGSGRVTEHRPERDQDQAF